MKRHLNLIPLTLRKRQLLAWQFRRWAVACGVAALLGGVMLNAQRVRLANVKQNVQHLDQQCATLRAVAEQSAASRTETRLLAEQLRWLRSLEQSDVPLLTLAAISQSTANLPGHVQLDRLQFDTVAVPNQVRVAASAGEAAEKKSIVPEPVSVHDRIELSGSASSDAVISSLLSRIEDTGLFDDVELVGLQARGQDGRSFQLKCTLNRDLEQLAPAARQLSTELPETATALSAVSTEH